MSDSSMSSLDSDLASVDRRPQKARHTDFRPSVTQMAAHNLVVHRSHKGKEPQQLLEMVQHSSHAAEFLKLPPVLRALFEFAFGDRGLTPMHCKPATPADKMAAPAKGVNFTDCSDKNPIKPAPAATCRSDVLEALQGLQVFSTYFYNRPTNDLIQAAITFLTTYSAISDRDAIGWQHISFWVSSKLGKYRGLLVCGDVEAALQAHKEFSRNDEDLAALSDLRRSQPPHSTPPHGGSSRSHGGSSTTNSNANGRTRRQPTQPPIPKALQAEGLTVQLRLPQDSALSRDETITSLRCPAQCEVRARLAEVTAATTSARLRVQAAAHGFQVPELDSSSPNFNSDRIRALSSFAKETALSLPDLVRMVPGETADDTRPNKCLFDLPAPADADMVPVVTRWNAVVRHGVHPEWSDDTPQRQQHRPLNHTGVKENEAQVRSHIVNGEKDGRYLVVDEEMLTVWPELFISPLGVVEKQSPSGSDIRVINDYSFPRDQFVNSFTVRDGFPPISYNPPTDIARRIHTLRKAEPEAKIFMMLGDVSGAFRHVPIHPDAVHMFAFRFDGYVIVDLACGFGWCGSPAFYALAGSITNYTYATSRPIGAVPREESCFEGNVWCDDHTCIEYDTGTRCHDADVALRRAMLSVLGPTSINERKFTTWSTSGKPLGLLWDTTTGTVSIPSTKLTKT